jgi:hypothetical protein
MAGVITTREKKRGTTFLSADVADYRRILAACLAAARQFTPPVFLQIKAD